jgi:hypothetical protein
MRHAMIAVLLWSMLGGMLLLLTLWWAIARPVLRPPPVAVPKIDKERVRRDVRMFSETFHPRSDQFPENLDRAAAYVRSEFLAAGGRVAEQEFEWGGDNYRNVIASFGPEEGPRVVVGAHYDAVSDTPGADDNASGVAGLLELGRMLMKEPPQGRVDLVAFTFEEPPHFRTDEMGSAHHAASLKSARVQLRGMICLEMIGYFSQAQGSQGYPLSLLKLVYPDRGDFIAVVGNTAQSGLTRKVKSAMMSASDLPVYSLNAPSFVPGIDFSDHLSYWAHGYPAVMVTDTAFYRNRAYHDVDDTWDRLDYESLGKVVQGVFAAVRDIVAIKRGP